MGGYNSHRTNRHFLYTFNTRIYATDCLFPNMQEYQIEPTLTIKLINLNTYIWMSLWVIQYRLCLLVQFRYFSVYTPEILGLERVKKIGPSEQIL